MLVFSFVRGHLAHIVNQKLVSAAAICLVVLGAIGCDHDPMIRVYEVELPKQTTNVQKAPAVGQSMQMLGAIVPAGDSAIFLKIQGSPEVMPSHLAAVKAIAESAKLTETGDVDVSLPDGWMKGGPAPMAAFTLIPPSMENVDRPMTVTILPGMTDASEWKAYVQQNVDRWRGQLGLDKVALDELLKDSVQEFKNANSELPAYLVSITGKSSGKSSMTPPFAGGSAMAPATPSKSVAPADTTSPSVPATDSPTVAQTLKYDIPEGWVKSEGSQMRIATFRTGTEESAAEVTIVIAGGDENGIAEMWAGQVTSEGTGELAKNAVAKATKLETTSGKEAKIYRIVPTGDSLNALYAAVIQIDSKGQGLFVKMLGPKKTVAENESKFENLVKSISW